MYYDGWPDKEIRLQRTPPCEMLDNDERVGFLDVMVDLIQKVVAGYVKTAFMDKTFPNNPAMKVGDQVFAIRLHC